jgi:hypothetical protein
MFEFVIYGKSISCFGTSCQDIGVGNIGNSPICGWIGNIKTWMKLTIMMKNNDHVNDINVIYHMDAINQTNENFTKLMKLG